MDSAILILVTQAGINLLACLKNGCRNGAAGVGVFCQSRPWWAVLFRVVFSGVLSRWAITPMPSMMARWFQGAPTQKPRIFPTRMLATIYGGGTVMTLRLLPG